MYLNNCKCNKSCTDSDDFLKVSRKLLGNISGDQNFACYRIEILNSNCHKLTLNIADSFQQLADCVSSTTAYN